MPPSTRSGDSGSPVVDLPVPAVKKGRGRPRKTPTGNNTPEPVMKSKSAVPPRKVPPRPTHRGVQKSTPSTEAPLAASSIGAPDSRTRSSKATTPSHTAEDSLAAEALLRIKTGARGEDDVVVDDNRREAEGDEDQQDDLDGSLTPVSRSDDGDMYDSDHMPIASDRAPARTTSIVNIDAASAATLSECSESIEPAFTVTLQVPVDGALDTLTVLSNIGWENFQDAVTEQMDIRTSKLKLSYKFSNDAKSDMARRLASAANLLSLMTAIEENQLQMKKSRAKKPFTVTLFQKDIETTATSENKGKHQASGSRSKASGKKTERDENMMDAQSEFRSSSSKFVMALQLRYKCEKENCHSYCWVRADGMHVKLDTSHLSLWGLLLSFESAKLDELPEQLLRGDFILPSSNSMDHVPRRRGTNGSAQKPAELPQPQSLSPSNNLLMAGAFHPHASPYGYYQPIPAPYPPYHYHPHSGSHRARSSSPVRGDAPSSDGPISTSAEEDPTIFPLVTEWLRELDTSARGKDGTKYSQYIYLFEERCIDRIVEIGDPHSFSAQELEGLFGGNMPIGHANCIITYARKDVRSIRERLRQDVAHERKAKRPRHRY